jgi:hypothetical protein
MATATGSTAASFGYHTLASGHKSTALGSYSSTNGMNGSFVYGDASTTTLVKNTVGNQFMIRAAGGIVFYSDVAATIGVEVAPGGGAWNTLSDSTKKENFIVLENDHYLHQFKLMDIYLWNYKTQQNKIKHMGPTAQSFYRMYHMGENNTSINLVDADGLTLHMIKSVMTDLNGVETAFLTQLPQLKAELKTISYDDLFEQLNSIKTNLETLKHD